MQLPAGGVIDISQYFSGCDDGTTATVPDFSTSTDDPKIVFAPNGSVDSVYINGVATPVTQPIFLLVGKRERIPANPAAYVASNPTTFANWQDLTNLWIVIIPQTGLVSTVDMAATAITTPQTGVPQARQLARDAQSMGGR